MAADGFVIGPLQYVINEVVEYNQTDHLIVAIQNSLGFNTYQLLNLDTGATIRAHIHQLNKKIVDGGIPVVLDDLDTVSIADWPGVADITATGITDTVPNEPRPSERFPCLSEDDLNQLASQCTEKSTDSQTVWGVKLLRGRLPCLRYLLRRLL